MTLKRITAAAIAGLLAVGFAAPVFAQDMLHGEAAIAKRQELMKSNGGTMKAAGAATGADAVKAAQTLVGNFAALGTLWPDDSQTGNTKALPSVWTDNAGFLVAYNASVDAAAKMLAAAEAGDAAAYGNAIKAMGGTCGGCHTKYRAQ